MAVTNTCTIKDNWITITLKDASDTSTTGDIYWCDAANVAGLSMGCISTDESFRCRSITWFPAGATGQYVWWNHGSLTGPVIYKAFFGAGTSTLAYSGITQTYDPPINIKPVWDCSTQTFTTGGIFTFTIA